MPDTQEHLDVYTSHKVSAKALWKQVVDVRRQLANAAYSRPDRRPFHGVVCHIAQDQVVFYGDVGQGWQVFRPTIAVNVDPQSDSRLLEPDKALFTREVAERPQESMRNLVVSLYRTWNILDVESSDDDTAFEFEDMPPDPVSQLQRLRDADPAEIRQLICEAELTRFDAEQTEKLLPILWQYILDHRDSNDPEELVAVGAAIRKYVALMPMDRMGELATLLEAGHRTPLPIVLEIEVAKMIYRNFEVFPPTERDPHPGLADRLWEMVQAYTNPRVLVREKHSAAASLAIAAIVAMRSNRAEDACRVAQQSPYRWFAEIVSDDINVLKERWRDANGEAANWLEDLMKRIVAPA